MNVFRKQTRRGFTLVEVVISVGVLAIALPLVMAAMVASGTGNRDARDDTRAALAARSIRTELALARGPGSQIISQKKMVLPFPSADQRLVFLLDADGKILRLGESGDDIDGVADAGVSYIGTLQAQVSTDVPMIGPGLEEDEPPVAKVVITVESPASAPKARRRSYRFVELTSSDAP